MSELRGALRALAAFGLPGSTLELPTEPFEAESWKAFLGFVADERLQGLLAFAVAREEFVVTPAQRVEVGESHRLSMAHVLRLERLLLQCADVMADKGIEFRLLKGPAVAHLDYPDPSLRPFVDLDLLVAPKDLPGVVSAFGAAGAVRRVPEVRSGFDSRFAKSVTLHAPGGFEIDLHRTFAMDAFGFGIDLDELFEEPADVTIGGRHLPALPLGTRFLHSCYHALLGDSPPRLLALRDVIQLELGGVDCARVVQQAERWGGGAVVAHAIKTATATLGEQAPEELASWAAARQPTAGEIRAMRGYTASGRSQAGRVLSAVAALPTLTDRARYLRALILPSKDFAASRGGRLRWLRRGIRRFLVRRRKF